MKRENGYNDSEHSSDEESGAITTIDEVKLDWNAPKDDSFDEDDDVVGAVNELNGDENGDDEEAKVSQPIVDDDESSEEGEVVDEKKKPVEKKDKKSSPSKKTPSKSSTSSSSNKVSSSVKPLKTPSKSKSSSSGHHNPSKVSSSSKSNPNKLTDSATKTDQSKSSSSTSKTATPASSSSKTKTSSSSSSSSKKRDLDKSKNDSKSEEQPDKKRRRKEEKSSKTKDSTTTKDSATAATTESTVPNDPDYDEAYFKRMSNRTKDPFHDKTDKELFTENVWKNIKGKEAKLCTYRHSSDCINWLLEHHKDNIGQLKKFTEQITGEVVGVEFLTGEFSSSVYQTLLEVLIRILSKEENFETSTSKWIIKYVDSMAKLILDNLQTFTLHCNNNFVLNAIIEAIGGIRAGRHWTRKTMRFGIGSNIDLQTEIEKDILFKELPTAFKHTLKKFAKALVLDAPPEMIRNALFGCSTSISQYLLFVLKLRYTELCQMVVKHLVEIVFEEDGHREFICQSASSAYIVEIMMLVASDNRLHKIWTKYLKGKLRPLWKHDIANFIVQRLIDAIKDENLFIDVCQEIFPDLSEMFECNRPGIGVCISKAALRFKKSQNEFITALMKAFKCYEPKSKQSEIASAMLLMEQKNDRKVYIWLHGSLMMQQILSYQDPHKVSKSLVSLPIEDIVRICKDVSGSHVIDTFLFKDNVPLKHKSELVEKLLGHYYHLSMDKYGSRVVENILNLADSQVKRAIMDELSVQEAKLKSSRTGWFLAKKVGLHHYKNRPNDWKDVEQNRIKRRREFNDFLSSRPVGFREGRGNFGGAGGGDRGRRHGGGGGMSGGRGNSFRGRRF